MKATSIRQQLHTAIDKIEDDAFLKAINIILQQKSSEFDFELNASEKKELDKRRLLHFSGKSKSVSFEDIKKHAVSLLKK